MRGDEEAAPGRREFVRAACEEHDSERGASSILHERHLAQELARELATKHGMVLFFDEIQSFAKKSPGGAQQDFGVTPDLCTIGKSLGAGLPLSAIAGKADLMDRFKPTGPVAH